MFLSFMLLLPTLIWARPRHINYHNNDLIINQKGFSFFHFSEIENPINEIQERQDLFQQDSGETG